MKKIILLLIIMILPLTSTATIRLLTSADLPYATQANGDTLRFSGTKISSAGDGIVVNHSNIFIDGQGDTLTFGSGGGGFEGIFANNVNITVRDLWLIQEGTGQGCDGIELTQGVRGLTIIGVRIKVYGNNSQCLDSYGSGTYAYDIYVDSCHFWNYSTGYDNRMHYDGAAVRLELRNPSIPPGVSSARIYRSVVHVAPHAGIAVFGRTDAMLVRDLEIAYCSTFVDHQNSMYPVFDGTTGHSSANAYGILISYADGGTRIHHNYIGAGNNHGGSRGLMLEGMDGSPSDTSKIYNNVIDIHCGPDVNYSPARGQYVSSWAVRIRDIDDGTGEYLELYDNFVRITLDTTSQVGDAYGYWGTAINVSETKTHDGHFYIHDNHFEVAALRFRPETEGVAVRFTATPHDNTIKFYNNRIIAPSKVLLFESGAGIEFRNDTLEYAASSSNPSTFYMGFWNGNNTDNHIIDAIYRNGASDQDIVWVPSGSADLAHHRTVEVFVQGNNSLPVAGATVRIVNNYGQMVASGTSDGNGLFNGIVTYRYESLSGADSTNFNDFTITAVKGSDSTVITHTVNSYSTGPAITLQNTAGEQGGDTVAPGTILDLGAVGVTDQSVTLSWTAPGDDGTTGTASAYDIRYATFAINSGNWSGATPATGIPAPQPAGNAEQFTVYGLNGGTTYFFAIRTRDELHNWSEISNVVSAQPTDNTPPATVVDLAIINVTDGNFTLRWTAPGDNGQSGQAAAYDIRYYTSLITLANWAQASAAANPPAPQSAGNTESFTISGLTPGQTYYFALRTVDDADNWSGLSNVVSGGDVSDNTPPAAIVDLAAKTGVNSGEIILDWTAVGDDGNQGTAAGYQVRYSTNPINTTNWNAARIYYHSLYPEPSGQAMTLVMQGLVPDRFYFIAVRAYDDNANLANISNNAQATAQSDIALGEDDSVMVSSPANNSTVHSRQPILTVVNVNQAANTYHFEVAEDAGFLSPVISGSSEQMAGDYTSFKVPIPLTAGQTYFWRARVNSEPFTDYARFTVIPQTHVYPNPFKLAEVPEVIFTEIPENSSLIIMTVSGMTVREWTDITGGEVSWNGTNGDGSLVASGTYLWFIEDTDRRGKIIVIR